MDLLEISQLAVNAHIGVYAWEQKIKQKLLLDIAIAVDSRDTEEDLNRCLDYSQCCEAITSFLTSKPFQLIETVANETADLIKARFDVNEVTVTVSKPNAVKNAGNIKLTVRR